jgi:hypothetical protein
MDRAEQYPDPFGEALSHSSSRAAQMISLAAAAAEVAARRVALRNVRQATHDEQSCRTLQDAERAAASGPGSGGHLRTMPGGWPRRTSSRWRASGAPRPRTPVMILPRLRHCAERGTAAHPAPVRDGSL